MLTWYHDLVISNPALWTRGDGEVKWKVRGMRGGMETNVYM